MDGLIFHWRIIWEYYSPAVVLIRIKKLPIIVFAKSK